MKVKTSTIVNPNLVEEFVNKHIGETYTLGKLKSGLFEFIQEKEQTIAEIHMETIRHIIDDWFYHVLNDEEKAALEYAIECIKTLDDMGMIKENNDD